MLGRPSPADPGLRVDGDRTLLNLRSVPPSADDTLADAVLEVGRRWT